MENTIISALLGLLFLIGFFCLSFFITAIAKIVFLYFKPNAPKKPTKQKRKNTPKKVTPIKSIEINPDEVDKIYVRKSS